MGFKGMKFPKPCIVCGQLSMGSRCQTHTINKATLYNKTYKKHAAFIRATATTCHLCGDGARQDDPWTADHIDATNPNSPLAAAHRSCNSRRGNTQL